MLHWISQMGGAATLVPYGFNFEEASLDFVAEVIDRDHIEVLRAAPYYVELDHHILVHADWSPAYLSGLRIHTS
ncbi:hypothetical protein GFL88_32345 [Rhizobium leguminosarum bv. viciae]|uniref:hypothetical protein n=1 Tax=Rhizobium leguminosarum TaxID=384 RepID=UPI001441902A|nr:hypothetical protein [Rhizobium leguminosarum]NKK68095.1 hypothetical protein [Rhizobium leguminosarum bv. viciae]